MTATIATLRGLRNRPHHALRGIALLTLWFALTGGFLIEIARASV